MTDLFLGIEVMWFSRRIAVGIQPFRWHSPEHMGGGYDQWWLGPLYAELWDLR